MSAQQTRAADTQHRGMFNKSLTILVVEKRLPNTSGGGWAKLPSVKLPKPKVQ